MPKMKTKSSPKKRFRIRRKRVRKSDGSTEFVLTVMAPQAYKRHNMRKLNSRAVRQLRRTTKLNSSEAKRVLSYAPYGLD